jgi:hypothetical protein
MRKTTRIKYCEFKDEAVKLPSNGLQGEINPDLPLTLIPLG